MDHRTYGETKNCKGCRFWSEMIAKTENFAVVAMCLSKDSPNKGNYMAGHNKCSAWDSGYLGAVDEPGIDNMAIYQEAI